MGKWKVIDHYDEVIFDDLFDTKAEADAMVERLISTICDDEDRCFDYAVDYFDDDKLNMSYQEYIDSIDKGESDDAPSRRISPQVYFGMTHTEMNGLHMRTK